MEELSALRHCLENRDYEAALRMNNRRKSGGRYMSDAEMLESIEAHYPAALRYAALEAFGGRYDEAEVEQLFSVDELKQAALDMIAGDFS
jgi:hypothetical protein